MAGRPLKFQTVKELEDKSLEYLNNTPKKEWTITGLALALDTSRETLCDYEHKDEFSYTIKRLKLMIENSYEIDLKEKGNTGTIFALKNFGWKDKQEIDQNLNGNLNINQSKILDAIEQSNRPEDTEQGVENEQPVQDNQ